MEGKEARGEGGRREVEGEMEGKEGGARVGGEKWEGRWKVRREVQGWEGRGGWGG